MRRCDLSRRSLAAIGPRFWKALYWLKVAFRVRSSSYRFSPRKQLPDDFFVVVVGLTH